ncbi:7274_t:CDS:2 [Ambispora gerdemannii]|uniref:7274_t:CDS:1 n=1 Tax=Ambispora gerdemannii TaxID=144530 RepID=A0A9N8WCE9_9GLOM|nr:7274_t:CDS:2 [Ambispora gerdemannii]
MYSASKKASLEHRLRGNEAMSNGDFKTALEEYNKGIPLNPDDGILWSNRSLAYLKLGHPELALVDTNRASIILIDPVLGLRKLELVQKDESISPINKLKQVGFKNLLRNAQAYSDLELFIDAIKSCQELMKLKNSFTAKNVPFNWIEVERLLQHCQKRYNEYVSEGDFKDFVQHYGISSFKGEYPWQSRKTDRFSEENFRYLKDRISEISASKVKLVKVNLGQSSVSDTIEIQYGIEAQEKISSHELIFKETPFITVYSRIVERCDNCSTKITTQSKFKCPNSSCKEVYCNIRCYQQALELFHNQLCGKDITGILTVVQKGKSTASLNNLFLIKLFAIAKQRDISPLDIKEIRHMTSSQQTKHRFPKISVHLYEDVMRILEIPIGDLRFDFWVFNCCLFMLSMNVFGERNGAIPDKAYLFSLLALINHQCDPNASTIGEIGNQLISEKVIQKGEAITINYDPRISSRERAASLYYFFGINCKCPKCRTFSGSFSKIA